MLILFSHMEINKYLNFDSIRKKHDNMRQFSLFKKKERKVIDEK